MKGKASKAAELQPSEGGRRTRSGRTLSKPETSGVAPAAAQDVEQLQQQASQEQQTVEQTTGRRKPVLRDKKSKKKPQIQPPVAEAAAEEDAAAAAPAAEPSDPGSAAEGAAAAEGHPAEHAEVPAGASDDDHDTKAPADDAAAPAAAEPAAGTSAAAAGDGKPPAQPHAASPARAGRHADVPSPARAAAAAGSTPAQQRRTAQHVTSPVLGPVLLVPLVPSATVRMGGAEFPAGQHGASRRNAAAGRSPGQAPRATVSWCHPATAAQLPERDVTGLQLPPAAAFAAAGVADLMQGYRSPTKTPPRPRGTVTWCQPAEETPQSHR